MATKRVITKPCRFMNFYEEKRKVSVNNIEIILSRQLFDGGGNSTSAEEVLQIPASIPYS